MPCIPPLSGHELHRTVERAYQRSERSFEGGLDQMGPRARGEPAVITLVAELQFCRWANGERKPSSRITKGDGVTGGPLAMRSLLQQSPEQFLNGDL